MSQIVCKLFGTPSILRDGEPVFFPYAKINALLYYVLVNKVVSRDETAGLLWPEEADEKARKNLRNAVYQAKRALGADIIVSPKKSMLMLNRDLEIQIDVDSFLQSSGEALSHYTGEFLHGFFLKDAEGYEDWVNKMRELYQEKFSTQSYRQIEDDISSGRFGQVEGSIRRLIEMDEYDERNFRLLMRFYQETGRNGKVIETYYGLAKLLRQDLGIDPDQSTKDIYECSLDQIHVQDQNLSSSDAFFYGRHEQLAAMEKVIRAFRSGEGEGQDILITGEPGSGKSTIKGRLLEECAQGPLLLETGGCQAERDMSLRPWRAVVRQISAAMHGEGLARPELWDGLMTQVFPDFQEHPPREDFFARVREVPMGVMVQIIGEALNCLAGKRRVILVFENLQWMDGESLRLLTAVLLETAPQQVMLLGTASLERSQDLENALAMLSQRRRLFSVSLERFTIEACHHFLERDISGRDLTGELLERLYNETQGNPLFLGAYLDVLRRGGSVNATPPAVVEAVKRRFVCLTQGELELLRMVSLFYDRVPVKLLLQLVELDEGEVLSLVAGLERQALLEERDSDQGVMLSFTHRKLREYLYQSLAVSQRRFLHKKIGLLLERSAPGGREDSRLYAQLIYHFTAAGDHLKAVRFRVARLNDQLNFSHEMFPVLTGWELESGSKLYLSREQVEPQFRQLEADLQALQAPGEPSREWDLLELEFYYMKGRYEILAGRYESGVADILKVIDLSKETGRQDYTFEGYKQIIYYYLQINAPSEMSEYIDRAMELAVRCNNHREIGLLLRLKGLRHMLVGEYDTAERLFTESVHTFTLTEEMSRQYAINIAAAYSYIGELRLAQGDYTGALALFQRAISLCPASAYAGLSNFYINGGKTCYFMGDTAAALDYFRKAYALYGQFDSFWRRSILDAYTALALLDTQDLEGARAAIVDAEQNAGAMKSPSDQGTVYFALAVIRSRADREEAVAAAFQGLLEESCESYCGLALRGLNPSLDRYECRCLRRLLSRGEGK